MCVRVISREMLVCNWPAITIKFYKKCLESQPNFSSNAIF